MEIILRRRQELRDAMPGGVDGPSVDGGGASTCGDGGATVDDDGDAMASGGEDVLDDTDVT